MLKTIEDTLHKTCLIGLSYFNVQGEQLKQNILAGKVIKVDSEIGITVELSTTDSAVKTQNNTKSNTIHKGAHFIIPTNLSCWFNAPKGEFHTSQAGVKIINPDYLVTWDIYQMKEQQNKSSSNKAVNENLVDSEQQWWQWRPRTQAPNVG